ncbi:hypothetical protein NQ318_004479 [Aromia moschata]|uniref:RING-type domain-containing protein n=1 Tax=Aromia moschata TaxID=1265417 RepID=A0AAV8XJR8_9CUCU|nr:hypothetical protein NQ318_004479 [Aromia moschata]
MNAWMHCNKCSLKHNSNIKLFLTECGHLFCERCIEAIRQTKCVYNFQMQHYNRLYQVICQKYAYAKKQCISLDNRCKNLIRENKMLKNMLMSMGPNHPPFLTSTPALTSDQSQTDNVSVMSSIGFTPSTLPMSYGRRVIPGSSKHLMGGLNQMHFFDGGVPKGPSPAQMVPNMNMGRRFDGNMPHIRRPPGTATSMEQLCRATKRT